MALFPAVGRKQSHVRFAWWTVVFVLCFGIFMHLIPFYFLFITSLKSAAEVLSSPPTFWPRTISFQAWTAAFQVLGKETTGFNSSVSLIQFFWNSLVMVGGILLFSTPITALSAYATSKLLRGPLARWIFLFFIGTMLVPGVITLVPTYLLVTHFPFATSNVPQIGGEPFPNIRMVDTIWAVIVPAIFNVGGYFFFKAFFDTIPDSVIQAARVDGGSEINIFRRIVLPMSIPVFAVVLPTQFNAAWDNYMWPSLVFQTKENRPLSVAVYDIIERYTDMGTTMSHEQMNENLRKVAETGLSWNGVMVLGILQTIPTFLIFVLSFRYLLSGIRIRGLK